MRRSTLHAVSTLTVSLLLIALPGCDDEETKPDGEVAEPKVDVLEEKIGRGKPAKAGDVVCIDFRVFTPDGEEVLWGDDFCFEMGAGAVIAGLDDSMPGMRAGGFRKVECPPHKHWGRPGYADGKIPANTPLVFDIKLRSIQ